MQRIGFGVVTGTPLDSPAIASLDAGLYLDWSTSPNPRHLDGATYIQTVRVHQDLVCPLKSEHAWNRSICPYATPHSFSVDPPLSDLGELAHANPGAIWLIGNEMDRRDWYLDGQDEMLPELYARAYGTIHQSIKDGDPTARIGIGGVVQPTPLRLRYLDRVWQAYAGEYGSKMPVDIWNIHNFVLREVRNDYGADIPPGLDDEASAGVEYASDWSHIDLEIFEEQIRAFRLWMAQKGEQEKPLMVSEYGVLYSHCAEWLWGGDRWICARHFDDSDLVKSFMLGTFDYFLNATDCSIGYRADGCRLVQQWIWFSLDHEEGFNPHAALYDRKADRLTPSGEAFAHWVAQNRDALSLPVPGGYRSSLFMPVVVR